MTTTVKVTFSEVPTSAQISVMETWISPYIAAGNTQTFPIESPGNATIRRVWDSAENAQAFIVKVNEIYPTASSAVIV